MNKSYRLRIGKAGVTSLSASTDVDVTYTDEISSIPQVGGQIPRPLEGKAESLPWVVDLQGTTNVLGNLGSTDGYLKYRRRLADISASTGGGMVVKATGRVQDYGQPQVGGFRLRLADERLVERTNEVFTGADSCCLWPHGVRAEYNGQATRPFFARRSFGKWKVNSVTGRIVRLTFTGDTFEPLREEILGILQDDLSSTNRTSIANADGTTVGNFKFLRFREVATNAQNQPATTGHADHQVIGWAAAPNSVGTLVFPGTVSLEGTTDGVIGALRNIGNPDLVWASTNTPTVNSTIRGSHYMPGRPPDELLPMHLGLETINGNKRFKMQPGTILKNALTGAYSSTASLQPRLSTSVFGTYSTGNVEGLLGNPDLPLVEARIDRVWNQADFTEAWCKQFGYVPFVNAAGELAPRRVMMPAEPVVPDVNAVPVLDNSNLTQPPSWDVLGRDMVTAIRHDYPTLTRVELQRLGGFGGFEWESRGDGVVGFDWIEATRNSSTNVLAGSSSVGKLVHEIEYWAAVPQANRDELNTEIFSRYGGGSIPVEAVGFTSSTEVTAISAGDFVTMDVDTWPNLATNNYGGARLLQAMSVDPEPRPTIQLLDAGPANQPLAAPVGTTISKSTSAPKNTVIVTAPSTGMATGATAHWQIAAATSTTPPVSSSRKWHGVGRFTPVAPLIAFKTVTPVPVGRVIHMRARQLLRGRIPSQWTTPQNVTMDGFDGNPSGCGVGSGLPTQKLIKWTNGDTDYPTQVRLNGVVQDVVPPREVNYTLTDLTPATTGLVATVRHIDP